MGKCCHFVSDQTPDSEPNVLWLCQRDDCDIEMHISIRNPQEKGVSFRASGSRLRNWAKIIKLFSEIIDLINEENGEEKTNG